MKSEKSAQIKVGLSRRRSSVLIERERSQFHTKHSSILDDVRSLNFPSNRFGVMLVEKIIETGRNSQVSSKMLQIARGIRHE
jgi:hypothetical protein